MPSGRLRARRPGGQPAAGRIDRGHHRADGMVGQAPDDRRQALSHRARARGGLAGVGLRREGVSRLHGGHRGDGAGPQPPQGGGDDARAGRHAAARLQLLPHPAADPSGQGPLRPLLCRSSLLLELGSRSQRDRDQAGAQVGQGARRERSRRHHQHARGIPRPYAGHGHGHRPGEVPPRLRAAARRLQVRALQ